MAVVSPYNNNPKCKWIENKTQLYAVYKKLILALI